MKIIVIILIAFNLSMFCAFTHAQEEAHAISSIKEKDKKLIGIRLQRAVKLLDLDTNFTTISEPPGKYRGVTFFEIEGWQVQLIVKRTLMNKEIKKHGVYRGIKNKRIIGISWQSKEECKSIGEVIPQFAYDKYGPCK